MFDSMFGGMSLQDYEKRKIGRFDKDGIFISTAAVTDGRDPYETAIEHPEYNNGAMIIVESYKTKKDAKAGHAKWVKKMTSKRLPKSLTDCANSWIQRAIGKEVFVRDPDARGDEG